MSEKSWEAQAVGEIIAAEKTKEMAHEVYGMMITWIEEEILPLVINTPDEFFWQERLLEYQLRYQATNE